MNKRLYHLLVFMIILTSCTQKVEQKSDAIIADDTTSYVIDRFGDIEIMQYNVPNWDELSLQQKILIYYLSEATLCGRDIIFDQHCKYNLEIKSTLYNIINSYNGDKDGEAWEKFITYTKRFWFSNGIHHHYSEEKFFPEVTQEYFLSLLNQSEVAHFPLLEGEDFEQFKSRITNIIFNPNIAPFRCANNALPNKDLVTSSSVNFYEGVTQSEVEKFYLDFKQRDKNLDTSRFVSYGLNSKVLKDKSGKIVEQVYKIDGLYAPVIEKIVYWLEKAAGVAENDIQKEHIEKLIDYYRTGDLKTWDEYNVLWVKDIDSPIDYINGFIEVYTDPLKQKATWEAMVNVRDEESSKRTELIAQYAQWFEDHSPIENRFKKKEVKGVSAKVINVLQLGGACYPTTPIGVNLPNADWIRKEHGSKSVTIQNITYAYNQVRQESGYADEFYYSDHELKLQEKYGFLTDNLQVDLHECLGHGSGQLLPNVDDGSLKEYSSTIEETRADLFSLYFIADRKIVELGILPHEEAYHACYYKQMINGVMLQLNRIELGNDITQSHMQNRAIIANWCYEAGLQDNVMEKTIRGNKTYLIIHDYEKLRGLIGTLLNKVQHIKSTGNYAAAKELVEKYGVKINKKLHKEIKDRYALLDIAPYGGFVNPNYTPVIKGDKIIDVTIEYPVDYLLQMMQYDQKYTFLK